MFKLNQSKLSKTETKPLSGIYPYQSDEQDDRWVLKHLHAPDFEQFLLIMQQIVLGFNLSHPSLLPILGYNVEQANIVGWDVYLRLPRMEGNLKDLISHKIQSNNNSHFSEEQIVQYFYALVSGLEYLHQKNVAHRNIKLTNILFDQIGEIRLTDFFYATYVDREEEFVYHKSSQENPLQATFDSLFNNNDPTRRNFYIYDIFCLGIVLIQLCGLRESIVEPAATAEEKVESVMKILKEVEGRYSHELMQLIMSMITPNLARIHSMSEIKKVLEEKFIQPNRKSKEEYINSPILKAALHSVKQETEVKWSEMFHFDLDDQFTILSGQNKQIITDQALGEFMEDLVGRLQKRNLQRLEVFSFNLRECKKLTDEGFDKIGQQIGPVLTNLKKLSIDFSWDKQITDKGLIKFITHISPTVTGLQHIFFDFRGCVLIGDKGFNHLNSYIGSRLSSSLQYLSLNFRGCPLITDKGLQNFSSNVGVKFVALQELFLDFEWCKITDQALANLATHIKTDLINLQSVSLNEKTLNSLLQTPEGKNCNVF